MIEDTYSRFWNPSSRAVQAVADQLCRLPYISTTSEASNAPVVTEVGSITMACKSLALVAIEQNEMQQWLKVGWKWDKEGG